MNDSIPSSELAVISSLYTWSDALDGRLAYRYFLSLELLILILMLEIVIGLLSRRGGVWSSCRAVKRHDYLPCWRGLQGAPYPTNLSVWGIVVFYNLLIILEKIVR